MAGGCPIGPSLVVAMAEEREHPMTGNHVKYITGDTTSSDAVAGQYLDTASATISLGKEDKTLDISDSYLCWDTSIPVGATINRAAITVVAESANTITPLVANIKALAPGPWSAESDVVTQDRSRLRATIIGPPGLTTIGQAATTATADQPITISKAANLDSAAQVITPTSTSAIEWIWVYAYRNNVYGSVTDDTGIVWWEIWSVTGSAGSYREDALLATSDNRTYHSIQVVSGEDVPAIEAWYFSGANSITLSSGTNYLFKSRIDGLDGDQALSLSQKVETSTQSKNQVFYGDFDGFSVQTYPSRDSIITDTGYVAGQTYGSVSVKATAANVAQNFGEATAPAYTPAAADPSTSLDDHLIMYNGSTSIDLELVISVAPDDVLVGDHIYVEYADEVWETNGNFSTEDLHQKWWKVLGIQSVVGGTDNVIRIEWDQTFSGLATDIMTISQESKFWLARGTTAATGTVTGEVKRAVQDAVDGAGFNGRVAFSIEAVSGGTSEDAFRVYHAEERFLAEADYHGGTLWVNYTPVPPTGISVDAETSLSSLVDAAAGLGPRINTSVMALYGGRIEAYAGLESGINASATLSAAVNGSPRIN